MGVNLIQLVLFVWFVCFQVNRTQARCGFPDLPTLAQILTAFEDFDLFQNWNYFEERQLVKIICETGLVGYKVTNRTTNSTDFIIENHAFIECRDNRWNSTDLHCLQGVQLAPNNTVLTGETDDPLVDSAVTENLESLIDNNALTCVNITQNHLQNGQTFWFRLKLNDSTRVIPRVALIIENKMNLVEDKTKDNMSVLENLILELNNQANLSDTANHDGNVEVEEAKRFLDFVYQHEFLNQTHIPKMLLLSNEESVQRKERVIVTAQYEYRISIQVKDTSKQKNIRQCDFNEDVAISEQNVSSEFLIFDCHFDDIVTDKIDSIDIQLKATKLNDLSYTGGEEDANAAIQICGLNIFAVVDNKCGKPSVPIYGMVTQNKQVDGKLVAQYSCMSGYRLVNSTIENQRLLNVLWDDISSEIVLNRFCDEETKQWTPKFDDILCAPLYSCKNMPPLIDSTKFYFEFSKLDNLKRAIGDVTTATLRCNMLTDYVTPYTQYKCDQSGEWVRVGKDQNKVPVCRPLPYRTHRLKNSHYYHHYYHYYPNEPTSNRTTLLFGRQLNDNKYLTYYGIAGIIILFGGSFIVLFHVRRMAKKISRQMRERAYINAEKGGSDSFMPMSVGMDGNLPPYYNNESSYFDGNNEYSNDLPPPTTPISMPSTLTNRTEKDKNNLSVNFDSIKF